MKAQRWMALVRDVRSGKEREWPVEWRPADLEGSVTHAFGKGNRSDLARGLNPSLGFGDDEPKFNDLRDVVREAERLVQHPDSPPPGLDDAAQTAVAAWYEALEDAGAHVGLTGKWLETGGIVELDRRSRMKRLEQGDTSGEGDDTLDVEAYVVDKFLNNLAEIIQAADPDHPSHPAFEDLFLEFAEALTTPDPTVPQITASAQAGTPMIAHLERDVIPQRFRGFAARRRDMVGGHGARWRVLTPEPSVARAALQFPEADSLAELMAVAGLPSTRTSRALFKLPKWVMENNLVEEADRDILAYYAAIGWRHAPTSFGPETYYGLAFDLPEETPLKAPALYGRPIAPGARGVIQRLRPTKLFEAGPNDPLVPSARIGALDLRTRAELLQFDRGGRTRFLGGREDGREYRVVGKPPRLT